MALAIVLILLVIGSVLFHLISPWYFTDLASNWSAIDTTISLTFWVTGFVFVAVNLFMAYAIIRFRHKGKDQKADYEPENKKLEWWLMGITAVGVAAMLAPGLVVWAEFVDVPDDAADIEVIGQQWHWSYRFPGKDGTFGTVHSRLVSPENPFGMNPEDPNGSDDVLVASPELHLPLDQPVKLLLRSKDVLHDFAVAEFRVKMDLVPGMVTYMWLTPTKAGTYEILCEELCGMAHHTMRGRVIVEEEADFTSWLAGYPTYAETVARPAGDPVVGQQYYAVCATCHGQQAEGMQVLNAPKLTGLDADYMKRQLHYYKTGVRGAHQDDIYGRQMAPMAATLIDDTAIDNVIAYIESLPDTPAEPTITGDVANGQALYETCASCHGKTGNGIWAMKAPKQSGMNDWYLVSQLQNFKKGVRGAHGADMYGIQMRLMANTLHTDQDINDVVAYINTLN